MKKFETSEKQSKDKNDSSSRFDGTHSVNAIYRDSTPGQSSKHIIKKIVKEVYQAMLDEMTAKELEKTVKAHGWKFSRQKGSHMHYHHPKSNDIVTIPSHTGDVHSGLAKSILKKAKSVK